MLPYAFITTVRLGFKSLLLHKLRSMLTMLGIIFGVCSVIAMLAIGEGASFEAQEQIKNLGSQNIILRSMKPPEEQKISDKASQSYVMQYGITYADVKGILKVQVESSNPPPAVTETADGKKDGGKKEKEGATQEM